MSTVEAGALADKIVRLKLVSAEQLPAILEEIGGKRADSNELLRCLERKGLLTPFQSSKILKGEMDGYFLGGYRLLYKISSGTFGRVFRADDPQTGRILAIKILRKKWSAEKAKVDLFEREGKMGMTLRHTNIAEILAVSLDRPTSQHYMVMEFVEGGNLRDILNIRKKLNGAETLRILEETTAGLEYASGRGVTHRDLKLTNVLLSSQGVAKLVDFGLAGGKLGFDAAEDPSVSRTVDYAGLEEATGAPRDDPRSDIFFLGCIAYELLSGKPPMERTANAQTRMQARRFLNIPPLKPEDVTDTPPSLLRLIEQMMALKPADRVQTPAQLLVRLREIRAEIEGKTAGTNGVKTNPTVFVVERDETLQDVLRTKLKEHGFRVLIAGDPTRALDRYRSSPFDLLIVDAITTGETGYQAFEQILKDAKKQNRDCQGVLMLAADQSAWKAKFLDNPHVAILPHPVKYKQLLTAIRSLMPGTV